MFLISIARHIYTMTNLNFVCIVIQSTYSQALGLIRLADDTADLLLIEN